MHLHNHTYKLQYSTSTSIFITMGSGASLHSFDSTMTLMSSRAMRRVKRLDQLERHEFWMHFVEVRHPLLLPICSTAPVTTIPPFTPPFQYVKGETWLTKIHAAKHSTSSSEDSSTSSREHSASSREETLPPSCCEIEYALPAGVADLESALINRKASNEFSVDPGKEREAALSQEQRLSCLYGFLLPHFLSSGHYDQFKRSLREQAGLPVTISLCKSMESFEAGMALNRIPSTLSEASGLTTMLDDSTTLGEEEEQKRAGHMLLDTASYFDESEMVARFMHPKMLGTPDALVQKLPYAVFVLPSYSSTCPLSPCSSFETLALAPFGHRISDRNVPGLSLRMPLLYANTAFTQATQYKAALIGGGALPAGLNALFGPDTEASQVRLIAEALESSEAAKVVLTLYRKNGTTFMAAIVLRPVFDQDGECISTMGFLVDDLGALKKMSEITALLPQLLSRPLGY
jgi:hypothetical protein